VKNFKLIAFLSILLILVLGAALFYYAKGSAQSYHFASSQPANIQAKPEVAEDSSKQTQPNQVTIIAVGDIMLSRSVAAQIKAHDIYYPFVAIKNYLHTADIVFANLENPITPGPVVPSGSMVFHANPGVELALKDAGFTILNLANNHTPNYGAKGVEDTLKALDSVGIEHIGAGVDLAAADQPLYVQKNGIKFALLGYNDQDVVPQSYGAAPNHPGTNIMSLDKVSRDVKLARQNADIVIVSMHSGIEYQPNPDQHQIDFAHAAIDAGADLVIGHHPHVIETVEKYKGKYIFYSLGNFVFDQAFSKDVQEGMTLKLSFNKNGLTDVQYNPVWIENLCQPNLVTDPTLAAEELNKLGPDR